MGKRFKFSEEQKNSIEKAVQNLEAKTSGEMVPYIVPDSDNYVEGTLYTIISFLIIGVVMIMGASLVWMLPAGITIIEILIFLIVMMLESYDSSERRMVKKEQSFSCQIQGNGTRQGTYPWNGYRFCSGW